jgi:hypothetical protein
MDALTKFFSAARLGWNRGRDSGFTRANRRLQGLLISFCGYCVALVFVMSLIAVAARRNIQANLEGATITAVAAFLLIKWGKAVRRSGISKPS